MIPGAEPEPDDGHATVSMGSPPAAGELRGAALQRVAEPDHADALDLQWRQPVVTVVEEPVPPMGRSAPQRAVIVLVSLLIGGIFGIGGAFGKAFLENQEDTTQKAKIDKIRAAIRTFFGAATVVSARRQ